MPVRIQLKNLPVNREPYWELAWKIGERKFKATVREGESWMGTSPRADIRIEAPGVRSRHLRIKRNGDRIFIQPLAGSAVVREGQLVEGFAPMAAGVPFLFGSVTATILRVEPRDYLNAVPIAVVSERPAAGLTTAEESSEFRHLACINAFARHLVRADPIGPEDLLDGLRSILAPVSAAVLFRTSEWVVLAEFAQGPSVANPQPSPGDRVRSPGRRRATGTAHPVFRPKQGCLAG